MTISARIDLNADLGEGFGIWQLGADDELLELITSANVACGFHAGDPVTMRRVCAQAVARGVAIGAQVGYRDLAGFGRRRIDIAADELSADVLYQLGALDACARAAGGQVGYLKPHGALYNTAMDDPVQAEAVIAAVAAYDPRLPVLGLPASALQEAADAAGIGYVCEAFADRAYTDGGRLVPRSQPGSVLTSSADVAAQALSIAVQHRIPGGPHVQAASICLHGDTPGAVEHARAVRGALLGAGVELARFATS